MSQQEQDYYEFDGYRLDVRQKVLLRDSQPVPLTPKAFDTLLMLVENSGRVLEKEEMMKHVWPDTFVEEANLANNISLLRKSLAEGEETRQYIQTVPRRGYRFIANVTAISDKRDSLILEKHTVSSLTVEQNLGEIEAGSSELARAALPAAASKPPLLTVVRRGWWLLSLAVLTGLTAGLLISRRVWLPTSPVFHQLTFRRGIIWSARYAPDGQSIIYSAAWEGKPSELFSARSGGAESRPLQLSDASILAISKNGEMALLLKPRFIGTPIIGTLARLPLSGGEAPREVLEDVMGADWSPDGRDLAVIRFKGETCRLEYPINTVLYQTDNPGWISDVRISPDGNLIAFLEHPTERFDDRGLLVVIDHLGKKVLESSSFTSIYGLAWAPKGDEVWFTASGDDLNNELYALSLSGRVRTVSVIAGRLMLNDISNDGRALLVRDNTRIGITSHSSESSEERDLSWFDGSWLRDISVDGKTILFDEESEGGGATAAVYLRGTDGSPAVRLGDGHAIALSPDGKWVLARQRFTTPPKLTLFPAGVGEQRDISMTGVDFAEAGAWFSDSRHILLMGTGADHSTQCYIYDLGSSQISSLRTPAGASCTLPSPDGKFAIVNDEKVKLGLLALDSGEVHKIPGLEDQERIIRWSADGRWLYIVHAQLLHPIIYRVDVSTGQRELVKEILPSDPAGLLLMTSVKISADGKTYAYTYWRTFTDLFSVDGLK